MAAMPLIHVFTSAEAPNASRTQALLKALSARLAQHFNKPERYVMTCLTPRAHMTFGGSDEPACYVEVKNIGIMTPQLTRAMSADLCEQLNNALGVPINRIYIEFADEQQHLWGYDGRTFA